MATGRQNKLVGQTGDYLVASELSRRGLIATTFTGNVPHYDIIASNDKGKHISVQVKNVFLSRLLFCFFAEDTHIFEDNQFTNAIDSHTQPDGSDLNTHLDTLFDVVNTHYQQQRCYNEERVYSNHNKRRGLAAWLD